jgi:hypothetical protein
MTEFLTDTPQGPLHKGDVVFYLKRDGTLAVVRASNLSTLTPSVFFGRTAKGKARCVPLDKITRIQRTKETT